MSLRGHPLSRRRVQPIKGGGFPVAGDCVLATCDGWTYKEVEAVNIIPMVSDSLRKDCVGSTDLCRGARFERRTSMPSHSSTSGVGSGIARR